MRNKKPPKSAVERREARLAQYDFVTFVDKYERQSFSLVCPNGKRTKGEMWVDICYKVAFERDKQNYTYINEEPTTTAKPPLVDPSATILQQKAQLAALEDWERNQAYLQEDLALWALIKRLRSGDKEAAVELIEGRQNHEYENFTFDSFTAL